MTWRKRLRKRHPERANQGKAWESFLDDLHALYARQGLAWVIRTPPPVKVLSGIQKGTFRACFEGEGPPDYAGAVRGVPVVFDAKSTARDRWPLAEVKPHQAAHLDAAQHAGAFAFVALKCPAGGVVLPWRELAPLWYQWQKHKRTNTRAPAGTASLSLDDIAAIGLPFTRLGWIDHVPAKEG